MWQGKLIFAAISEKQNWAVKSNSMQFIKHLLSDYYLWDIMLSSEELEIGEATISSLKDHMPSGGGIHVKV